MLLCYTTIPTATTREVPGQSSGLLRGCKRKHRDGDCSLSQPKHQILTGYLREICRTGTARALARTLFNPRTGYKFCFYRSRPLYNAAPERKPWRQKPRRLIGGAAGRSSLPPHFRTVAQRACLCVSTPFCSSRSKEQANQGILKLSS